MRTQKMIVVAAFALVVSLLIPLAAEAATSTWIDGNANWDIASDWSPSGSPNGTSNSAIINNGTSSSTVTVSLTSTKSLSGVTIGNSYNTLSINSTTLSAKTISLGGGTITGSGTASVTTSNGFSGYGTISGHLTTSSGMTVTGGTLDLFGTEVASGNNVGVTVSSASVLNIDAGGVLTMNNVNATLTNNGKVNLNGGTLNGVTNATYENYLAGTGPINVIADSALQGQFFAYANGDDPINIGNVGGAIGNLAAPHPQPECGRLFCFSRAR